ncbi:restriction endonuclease subunit S [Flavobacterium sp. ACAM 123]|uniref:restriction endonuclease subunit S n=1 Tax=Flavobacterium sp. ACAM 123 TaxID=1189620 RepID=UPI0002F67B13|nr:restriction endonuclease subunit S [Flavobacterium sp. ACAM 123]
METAVKNTTKRYDKYKPSGVEWLGDIPEHWEVSRLGVLLNPISINNRTDLSLLSITREKGVILRDLEDEGANHNFIPDDLSNYKVLLKGQFGMNKMKAWQGSYGISNYDGIVSPAYFIFDLEQKMTPEYFHLAIRSKLYVSFFGSASDGVRIGQWDLSKERMKQIPFLIPSLKEQTAISEFLDDKTTKIDQAIVIKQQQIELLEERKRIVIHKAVTQGINPDVKLKDIDVEWIGEIPEHWTVSRLGLMLTIYSIKNHPNELLLSITRELGVIVRDLENESSNHNFIPDDLSGYKLLKRGDFGMNKMKAWQGSYGVSNYTGIISPAYYTFSLVDTINPDFFHLAIRSKIYVPFFGQASDGVRIGQWDLSQDRMKHIPFVIPTIEEQNDILIFIETSTTKIATAISLKEQEIEKLKEYKSSLIDGVVTGKVRVC